jgi:hypothetical protein
LRRVFEAAEQLSDTDQNAIAARFLEEIEDFEISKKLRKRESDMVMEQSRPLTEQEFMEQLYSEGTILNIPTWEPLTEEEEAERARLARVFAGGKPQSKIVIEDRGPY